MSPKGIFTSLSRSVQVLTALALALSPALMAGAVYVLGLYSHAHLWAHIAFGVILIVFMAYPLVRGLIIFGRTIRDYIDQQ